MHLSVIIPAYNEEKRIGKTLSAICAYLAGKTYEWEVIVVDNRSKDRTARVVAESMETCPRIKIVPETRGGKGYAVCAGMVVAQGAYRLMMDADNSTSIDHLDAMMPYMSKGYDVVIGSLAVKGAKVMHGGEEPLWRVILGKLGNKWIQVFAVWGVNDTQRGFKVFSEKAAKDIFPRVTIGGWGFDIEVLALARMYGYNIKEVPVTWNNDPDSKVTIWTYPKVLLETLNVFWNRIRGVYKK
jgi:dolichyl-phosphate beta-glucosyltransferase